MAKRDVSKWILLQDHKVVGEWEDSIVLQAAQKVKEAADKSQLRNAIAEFLPDPIKDAL